MKQYEKSKSGAVSLFIVIFATLLITVVTVSFVRLMIKGQQQVSSTDLSQSAYDSAQAGVEDAKRALLRYQSICDSGSSADCAAAKLEINSSTCNTAVETLDGIVESDGEIKVETGGSNSLNQAYTCVKIHVDTDDYLSSLAVDDSKLVSLSGVSDFDSITIQWFDASDLSAIDNFQVSLSAMGTPLLAQNFWPSNRPPILKAQLIQVSKDGFLLSDFDDEDGPGSNTDTLFLYPSQIGLNESSFNNDSHKTASNEPLQIQCSSDLTAGGYACSATLDLPSPINGGDRDAFLNLTAIYNKTNYRVLLSNSGAEVKFDAVQPEIDSTGRASDLFRRVKTRVELGGVFPYPQGELDISGNLCKNFLVTDDPDDFVKDSSCDPSE